jgi:ATP-dependent Lon protease
VAKEMPMAEVRLPNADSGMAAASSASAPESEIQTSPSEVPQPAVPKSEIRNSKFDIHPVVPPLVRKLLGPEKYFRELDTRTRTPGVAVGLAYTPVGGEILFIEATSYAGKGNIILTGQIGDVMKESVTAAMSLFKSRAKAMNVDPKQFQTRDLHIHVPAGAVPKDGPSAGIAMYTAIASLMLGLPVLPGLAMTGEITLRGLVLPIGGVKEKTLAAARAGIRTVILPAKNKRDMEEVAPEVRKKLKFIFAETAEQVLEHALGKQALTKAMKMRKPI